MAKDAFTEQGVARYLEIHKHDSDDDITKDYLSMQAQVMTETGRGLVSQERMDELKALHILAMQVQSGERAQQRQREQQEEAKRAAEAERVRQERELAASLQEQQEFLDHTAIRSRTGLEICEVLRLAGSPMQLEDIRSSHPDLLALSTHDVEQQVTQLAEEQSVEIRADGAVAFRQFVRIPESLVERGSDRVTIDAALVDQIELTDNWASQREASE